MMTVKGAMRALRKACFSTTWCRGTPLSTAVRTYCDPIASAIDALVASLSESERAHAGDAAAKVAARLAVWELGGELGGGCTGGGG